MDIFKKRFAISDKIDINYEEKMDNTREMLEICMKKCGNFEKREVSSSEQICLKNCSSMLFNGFLKKIRRNDIKN